MAAVEELRKQRRLTIRALMVLVAIVASLLGVGIGIVRLWPRFRMARQEASFHDMESRRWSYSIQSANGDGAPVSITRFPMTAALRRQLESQGFDANRPYFYHWHLGYNRYAARTASKEPYFDELMAVCRERMEYHERMRRKWAWYAWIPWIEFEPDPPRPAVREPSVSQSF